MGAALPPSRRGNRRRPPMADINVTPLVDVMLVLLIIFMVTAPLLITGVPVRLPENRAKALEQDQEPMVVSIDASGIVYIGDDPVADAELAQRLMLLREAMATDAQLFLRADGGLDYERVMQVMGELNRAGLTRVALVSTAASDSVSSGSESGQ